MTGQGCPDRENENATMSKHGHTKPGPQQCGWTILTLISPHFTVHLHHHRCLPSLQPSPLPPSPPSILFHDARSETTITISDFSRSYASEGSVRPRHCPAHPDSWPADPLKTTEILSKGPSSFSTAPCCKVRHKVHKVNFRGPCAAPHTSA